MERVTFLCQLYHAAVGAAKLLLVETFAEAFLGLGNLFVNLCVKLGKFLLDEHIGAVALFRVAVVDQRVVECVYVTRRFPYRGVHEDSRVDTYDVFVEQCHCVPPVALDIVLELYSVLAVIVDCCESVIDFRRLKHKTVFLGV